MTKVDFESKLYDFYRHRPHEFFAQKDSDKKTMKTFYLCIRIGDYKFFSVDLYWGFLFLMNSDIINDRTSSIATGIKTKFKNKSEILYE